MNVLQKIACRIDTFGYRRLREEFKQGWPSQTSNDISFHSTAKVQYRYRVKGVGPTIVFCADPPVTLELYDELVELYSKKFRVIVFELPAMGFSVAQSNYTFGWQETNDDVAEFLKDVAGRGAVLAFSCVAGLAAIDIAVRYPKLVSKLILLQTTTPEGFKRWKSKRDPKQILAKPVIGQLVMKFLIKKKRAPDWYKLTVADKKQLPKFCCCAQESFEHGALWSLASAYQVYMGKAPNLEKPLQPTLALWGLMDGSHPKENVGCCKDMAQNVQYQEFTFLGHFSELEDPNLVYEHIERFVMS